MGSMIKETSREEALDKLGYVKNTELVDFLKNVKSDYIEYDELTKEVRFDEVYIGKRQFLILIGEKQIIFRDDLTDWDIVTDINKDVDFKIYKDKYEGLLTKVSEFKGELRPSGMGGNNQYSWYDLVFKMDNFALDRLNACENLWSEYNKELDQLI